MKDFFSFQALEFKRFFRIRNLIYFFLILIICAFSVNRSSVSFKRELSREKEFKENEAATFEKIMNYDHYSDKGINFLMVSSPTSIFFSSPYVLSELSSWVNSIVTVEINKNVQGRRIFKGNSILRIKFSDLVAYIGCFLALFMGAEAMGRKEYLKLLYSRMPGWKLHTYTILSLFVVLTAGFIVLSACMLVVPLFHGVGLANIDTGFLLVYLPGAMLILLFFLLLGAIMGSIAGSKIGLTPLLIVWFIFIILLPTLSDSIDEDIAESLESIHRLYHDKLKIVNDFEKRVLATVGKFDKSKFEIFRGLAEEYYKKEYPKIEALEKELRNEVARIIKNHGDRSIWTPITFYNSLCSELSSMGFENYLKFLDLNILKFREFTRFWIDMVYYVHHIDNKMENFFKKEGENIFKAKAALPANVVKGFAVNIIYLLILMAVYYFFSMKSLFNTDKEDIEELRNVKAAIKKNELSPWITRGKSFKEFLYHIFSGKSGKLAGKGIKGSVIIDKTDIGSETKKQDFLFLCPQGELPKDFKVKPFLSFQAALNKVPAHEKKSILNSAEIKPLANRYLADLKPHEFIEVLIAMTRLVKARLFLINDVATGLPGEYVVKWKEHMDKMAEAGILVVYLTTSDMFELHKHKKKPKLECFEEGGTWVLNVEAHKRILASE